MENRSTMSCTQFLPSHWLVTRPRSRWSDWVDESGEPQRQGSGTGGEGSSSQTAGRARARPPTPVNKLIRRQVKNERARSQSTARKSQPPPQSQPPACDKPFHPSLGCCCRLAHDISLHQSFLSFSDNHLTAIAMREVISLNGMSPPTRVSPPCTPLSFSLSCLRGMIHELTTRI